MDIQNEETTSNAQTEALNQIVKDLGIDNLEPEQQTELISKMTEVLLKRIFLDTMEKLSEQDREEYEKLTEGEVQLDQIETFFKEKIRNYDEMVENIVTEFRAEMLSANNN